MLISHLSVVLFIFLTFLIMENFTCKIVETSVMNFHEPIAQFCNDQSMVHHPSIQQHRSGNILSLTALAQCIIHSSCSVNKQILAD